MTGAISTDAERGLKSIYIHKNGQGWEIRDGGQPKFIKDLKGVRYVTHLLSRPNQYVPVAELVGLHHPPPLNFTDIGNDDRLVVRNKLWDPIVDHDTLCDLKQEISESEDERRKALESGDVRRSAYWTTKVESLIRQRNQVVNNNGKPRPFLDEAERMRKAVRKCIKSASQALGECHPSFGDYLMHTIKTGRLCVYRPLRDCRWTFCV